MATLTLTYADAARFQTKEQEITHNEEHPTLSLSNDWMDAKHVFERVQGPLIAPPTYIPDPAPLKETRTRATRNMRLTRNHKSAKENLPATPQQWGRVAGKPLEKPVLDTATHRRAKTARRVHHTLQDKAPPNNPFACLKVEHGESSDESDSETDYQSCTESTGEFIAGDGSAGESDGEITSITEDSGNATEGVDEQSLSSPVAYCHYLDAYRDSCRHNDEDDLPRNPPPSPALVYEDLSLPPSPGSDHAKVMPGLFRPSNPTPREAKFGPLYAHCYRTNSPTESLACMEGLQRPSSVELMEPGTGVPRLWKLMGWQNPPVDRA